MVVVVRREFCELCFTAVSRFDVKKSVAKFKCSRSVSRYKFTTCAFYKGGSLPPKRGFPPIDEGQKRGFPPTDEGQKRGFSPTKIDFLRYSVVWSLCRMAMSKCLCYTQYGVGVLSTGVAVAAPVLSMISV